MTWKATYVQDLSGQSIDQNETVWRNSGDNLWCWKDNLIPAGGLASKWLIASSIGAKVNVDGTGTAAIWYTYNGKLMWGVSGMFLWWDSDVSRWKITNRPGSCDVEAWDDTPTDPEDHEYIGDSWWIGPDTGELEGRYEASGNLRGSTQYSYEGTAKDVTVYFDGWGHDSKGTAPAGMYKGVTRSATVASDGTVTEDVVWGTNTEYFGYYDSELDEYYIGNTKTIHYLGEAGLWL